MNTTLGGADCACIGTYRLNTKIEASRLTNTIQGIDTMVLRLMLKVFDCTAMPWGEFKWMLIPE